MMEDRTNPLIDAAEGILAGTVELLQRLRQSSIEPPSGLEVGAQTAFWRAENPEISNLRSQIVASSNLLNKLLLGPHEILHELVSVNWDHAALYALLEWRVIDYLPTTNSSISVAELAQNTGLPREKLMRICRLAAATGIIAEPSEGMFGHTAISEDLVRDEGFRNFIGFQLFETRIASAHLSDSLRDSREFWTDKSAFKYAWGEHMYDWHAKNPDKGQRFAKAMESVAQGLDPGDGMIISALSELSKDSFKPQILVVEVSGKTGAFARRAAQLLPNLLWQVEDTSSTLLAKGQDLLPAHLRGSIGFHQRDVFQPRTIDETQREDGKGLRGRIVYLLRSALWSLNDFEVIFLLRTFLPALKTAGYATLLICDLVSPTFGSFPPYVEKIYRRRDVTLMTMHNVKQRTASEWESLFLTAEPRFRLHYSQQASSHSCRGLWIITLSDRTDDSVHSVLSNAETCSHNELEASPPTSVAGLNEQAKGIVESSINHDRVCSATLRRGRCSSSFADEL